MQTEDWCPDKRRVSRWAAAVQAGGGSPRRRQSYGDRLVLLSYGAAAVLVLLSHGGRSWSCCPTEQLSRSSPFTTGRYLLPGALLPRITLDNTNPPTQCNNTTPPSPRDTGPYRPSPDETSNHRRNSTRIVWTSPVPPPPTRRLYDTPPRDPS